MELVKFSSHGGLSVRSILTFALTAIAAALLWMTFASSPALAASEAHWGGDSIIYENHGFSAVTDTKDTSGTIPAGATIYRTPAKTTGTGANVSSEVFVIYFSPGVDPPTATTAQYAEFAYNGDDNTLSEPSNKQNISLALKSQQSTGSSCTVEGIGWILCPATTYLAEGMDYIFHLLAGMIKTQPPVLGDSTNSMYVAWNIMRSVANVAFVIAFLLIIYSQLTSIGISNYGLKKLIPRLIVAAVLVNLSFYIAALAIDISNVLGYAVQEVFNSIRESTFHLTDDELGTALSGTWAQIASIILAGGGLYAGAYYVAVGGGIYMLVPLLAMLLLTIMLVVVVLAARQAIILILVIIAPLAFVANLLPNTEKWFDKWKSLFMTMLVFFPAFSLVFGGSQLAGQLIIQNAGDNIVTVLFGLAVQVAPLVITPLILKFSGGLLGRIAQIANDPRKGVMDRSRHWANSRGELARQRSLAIDRKRFNPWRAGAAMTRRGEFGKRRISDKTDMWKQAATNRYEETPEYGKIHEQQAKVDVDKSRIHDDHAAHIDQLKARKGTPLNEAARRAQVSKDGLDTQQQRLSSYYNNLRTVSGSDLNVSNNTLEEAKANNETSEQNKSAYLNQQRTVRATRLGAAAERLEAAKLNAEGMQNTYTTHIDTLKANPETTLRTAAVFAQSSKEHSEAAQNRVQAMFDSERRTEGTKLNVSTLNLERTKLEASQSKDLASVYLNTAKSQVDGALHTEYTEAEVAKFSAQEGENRLKRVVEEYKAGYVPETAGTELASAIENLRAGHQAAEVERLRTSNAQKVQNDNLADSLINDVELRDFAGGINKQGSDAAMASAISTVRTAFGQSVNEARQIVKHFNLNSGQRQKLALLSGDDTLTVTRDDGTSHTFKATDEYAREAAIEDQVAVGTIDQVEKLVQASGTNSELFGFRTTIADALAKNGLGGKSLYLGGKTIDDVTWGRINGPDDILGLAVETIAKGKISEKDLANIDPIAVERLLQAAQRIKSGDIPSIVEDKWLPGIYDRMVEFSQVARNTLTSEESVSIKGKARPYIEEIGRLADPR